MNLISVHSLAISLSNIIAQELNLDNMKRAKISYGLEATIGAIIKLVLGPVIFLLFGVLKQSLIVMFTTAILRYASGGMHLKTFIGCFITSAAVFVSIGILSKILVINDYVYYILNIISFFIIILRSPVDPPEKPIKTKRKRYVMKLLSTLILLSLIYISSKNIENDVKNAIILGVYVQTLTLTGWEKIIHKYIENIKLKAKEVN